MNQPKQVPFAIVPLEAAQDHRLTASQYRVLIALLTFRNRASDTVYPTRAAIAERTGYSERAVSKATAALEKNGWVVKTGNGGRSSATRYRVEPPETLSDPDTVSDENPEQPGQVNPEQVGQGPLNSLDRGKEQTKEQTSEQRGSRPDSSSQVNKRQKAHLIAEIDLPPEIPRTPWRDYVWERYERGKPLTDRAAALAIKNLRKLYGEGNDLEEVLQQSIMNGWTGVFPVKTNGKNGHQQEEDPFATSINRHRWEGP